MPIAYSYVRYSSLEQKKGKTLERQQDNFKRICSIHGLTPANEVFYDLGKSGFKPPKNVNKDELVKAEQQAELKRFRDLVKDGTIKSGSWLVLDEISRLGRWERIDIEIFIRYLVLEGGLTVCMENMVVDKDNIRKFDVAMLIFIKSELAREESLKRQRFSVDSWTRKRANASTKPMTAKCPNWLIPQFDGAGKVSGFKVDEDKARIIRYIFSLAGISGRGSLSICQELNKNQVSTFSGKGLWWNGHILRIISDRRAIGEFKGIEGYFPAVVDKPEFDMANAARIKRSSYKGRSDRIGNLFTGIAWNVDTDARMVLDAKSAKNLRWVDAKSYLGNTSVGKAFPYTLFEQQFLRLTNEIKLTSEGNNSNSREISSLEASKTVLEARREALVNALDGASEATITATVKSLDKINDEIGQVSSKLEILNGESNSVSPDVALTYAKSICQQLKDATGEDLTELRLKLREAIRQLVDKIEVKIEKEGLIIELESVIYFKSGNKRTMKIVSRKGQRIFVAAGDLEGSLEFAEVDRKYYPELAAEIEEMKRLKQSWGLE